jgi:2-(1,2-epoxy-1,2-dihydrophenyl)acetyl-CoA isomerase
VSEPLLFHREGAVATLRFNRPDALNALDAPTARAMLEAARAIEADAGVRCVAIEGEGRAFAAGGDLGAFRDDLAHAAETATSLIDPLHAALAIFSRLDAPVIASVQGAAAGAGMSIALACDLVVAADDARFKLAYTALGTSADGSSSWSLPRILGLHKALEIALLNETLEAAEALNLGIVNKVVPRAELGSATKALAERLAAGPTTAYGEMKRLLRGSHLHGIEEQMQLEGDAFRRCARTADFAEGITAFFARRPAEFGAAKAALAD